MKKKRTFKDTLWCNGDGIKRFWLICNTKKDIVGCTVCRDFSSQKTLVTKCEEARKPDSINKHAKLGIHEESMKVYLAKQDQTKTKAICLVTKLTAVERQKKELLFRNAHALVE